jgi:hypothetical protein
MWYRCAILVISHASVAFWSIVWAVSVEVSAMVIARVSPLGMRSWAFEANIGNIGVNKEPAFKRGFLAIAMLT